MDENLEFHIKVNCLVKEVFKLLCYIIWSFHILEIIYFHYDNNVHEKIMGVWLAENKLILM